MSYRSNKLLYQANEPTMCTGCAQGGLEPNDCSVGPSGFPESVELPLMARPASYMHPSNLDLESRSSR